MISKKYIPTFYARSLFEVDPSFFNHLNVKVILLDLDNTLDSYRAKFPSDKTKDYINRLKLSGLRPIITSNNTNKRVNNYARALEIECLSNVGKPFKSRLIKKIKTLNINLKDCIIVGDQLMTDISCGNAMKIKTLLLEKLVKEDPLPTIINRLFDKPLRARLRKCGKLKYWNEIL